jgi:uncharacterized protein (TIGR02569 family)
VHESTPPPQEDSCGLPPRVVLDAWGASEPRLLEGGQGAAVRAGDLVFKRTVDAERGRWLGESLAGLDHSETVRIAEPVPTLDGEFVVDNWCAWRWLDGAPRRDAWNEILETSSHLHRALAHLSWSPRAEGLDPWSVADRAAWGESPLTVPAALDALVAQLEPVDHPRQVIHADLANNVVFHPGLPPGVIDISPFFRPAAYADAIVVADAIAWSGAPDELAERFLERHGPQLLLRAILFRVGVNAEELASYEHVANLIIR